MNFILISYIGGLSGQFVSAEIAKNLGFVNNKPVFHDEKLNYYIFPNYLEPIELFMGSTGSDDWPITEEHLNLLKEMYSSKRVIIPTHWINTDLSKTNIPLESAVRLVSNVQTITKLVYCMAVIKNKGTNRVIWKERQKDIEKLIANNHPQSNELRELLEPGKYKNWKYISYWQNLFPDGRLDLEEYLRIKFNHYDQVLTKQNAKNSAWYHWDLGPVLMNGTSFEPLEDHLKIKLDRQSFVKYSQRNFEVLHEQAGISVNDLEGDAWLSKLHKFMREWDLE